ncbi:nitronate monooxygenase [Mycolicibacterium komossense]|uniref:Propionate 3-nitronate monooxygenase n=1 Tax=Mycolicibacterium komossense TaxID=1779 RepID=A0ABT3CAC0_9MYCO|nr:nitronate monooxygenase [Mycolicibacterium komossense]MCV7226424.1 nitronate monooxygenase [Mycolicibacterium komossense]
MVFDVRDLALPIVGAPMAGGPSTPQLAAAVGAAGGLGFLAAGYLSAERFDTDIAAARAAGGGPLGVNLFAPGPSLAVTEELTRYRALLQPLAEHYLAELGTPHADDDAWRAKLDVVADTRPEVVSFTFACPEPAVLKWFRDLGILTLVTVTTSAEAQIAVEAGADGLIAQGPKAGGHRGTFDPGAVPADQSLEDLLDAVSGLSLPVIVAGGLATADDVSAILRRGAVAAQVGTALLLADEAGTNVAHRAALASPDFTETVVTRAFSGRYARGLRNDFTRRFDEVAPFGYPEVNQMTSPMRKAAVAAGDPHGTNLWAGTAFGLTKAGPAAEIVAELAGD